MTWMQAQSKWFLDMPLIWSWPDIIGGYPQTDSTKFLDIQIRKLMQVVLACNPTLLTERFYDFQDARTGWRTKLELCLHLES